LTKTTGRLDTDKTFRWPVIRPIEISFMITIMEISIFTDITSACNSRAQQQIYTS
jgi:hypothetical protein